MNVTLTTDNIAPFVWIDTKSDRMGTFSDNGFLMCQASTTVAYYSQTAIVDSDELYADLTVINLTDVIV